MDAWKVDTVYHAAAYKHVPLVENNITEGIINNTFGTLHAAQAALRAGVSNFVLVSTDKAVRPTNVMGGTKRMAELVLQALAKESKPTLYGPPADTVVNQTRFRSEEHTTEIQPLMRISYAVFCLTKKKHKKQRTR